MDAFLEKTMTIKVNKTIDSLKKNQMNGYHVHSIEDAQLLIKDLLKDAQTVSVGGSMTLFECGIIDMLRQMDITFWDRYKEGNTPEMIQKIYRDTFSADAFICSTNALTLDGELYNIDGTGNRVAAMSYGPNKVIILTGTNKLVPSIPDAITRLEHIASPANSMRINQNTPCAIIGECSHCKSPERICCSYNKIGFQRDKDRIHVIIIDGHYGY